VQAFFERAKHIFLKLINAGTKAASIEQRHQIRAMNTLIVVFVPLIPLFMLSSSVATHFSPLISVDTMGIMTAIVAEVTLLVCYVLNRSGLFSLSRWLLIIITAAIIIVNAETSSTSRLQILYLLALPTVGVFLFSRRQMLWLSAIIFIMMFWFALSHGDSFQHSITDLISVVGINCFLLLLVSLYRDNLEASRSRVLVEKETQLQLMLDNLPAIVWRLDKNLKPLSSAGGPRDTVMREQIVGSLVNEDAYRAALKVVLAGVSVSFEHISNGISCRSYAEAMYDANGSIIGCSGITIDISTQKQEEEQRQAAAVERERIHVLGSFLESASHDLRTPLAEMNMSVELLRRAPDAERREYHGERLAQGIRRLDHILEMMFTMVRLDVVVPEQSVPLDLNKVVSYVEADARPFAQTQKVALTSDLAPDLTDIVSYSEDALRMAVDHVLRNALQNTPNGGSVAVRTYRENGNACLDVVDTGVGIPAEELEYVFDRFYRVEKHRPLDEMHVGLGLAIAKRVVELHRGEIKIESQVGRGTRVSLCFPLPPTT